MSGVLPSLRALGLALLAVLLPVTAAQAHSYPDPALRTVFDGVQPALPAGVVVSVAPSVVDELVVSNPTRTPLEVLALGGEPFLRVSAAGVQANLASPTWYATGTPEGGPQPPADVLRDRGRGLPRWVLVSRSSVWSEFDPRLRPATAATSAMRRAAKDRVLVTWRIPMRYGGRVLAATGHVLFAPVRGGLTVAVTRSPVTATALQGELPGLFLSAPPGREVLVRGRDGLPFLRFRGGVVQADTASRSWVDDQRAKGREVRGSGWVTVARGTTYSWLDTRLRYPADQPPADQLGRRAVVQRWSVPVAVDGTEAAIEGTVTWVPRAMALRGLAAPARSSGARLRWWVAGAAGAAALLALLGAQRLRRRRR
jgi:hypothetical protein